MNTNHFCYAFMSLLIVAVGCLPSDTGDKHVDNGMELFDQRKFSEAIVELEQALEKPLRLVSRSQVLTMIGNCYKDLDDYEHAMEYHNRALKEDPNNHQAYVNKGIVYRLQGEFDQAKMMYDRALELKPDYAELHASMGALAIFQSDYDSAIKHLEKSIKLDNNVAVAHSNLAVAYAMVGRFDEAEESLKAAIQRGYYQPEVIRQTIDKLKERAKDKQ